MSKRMFDAAVTGFLLLALCGIGLAQDSSKHPLEASVGLGVLFDGTFTVANGEEVDVDSDAGFYGKGSFDYFPIEYFGVGLYVSGGALTIPAETSYDDDVDIDMAEVGLGIKPRIPIKLSQDLDLLITPSLYVGYRGLFTDDEDFDGLGLNFGVDLRLRWDQFSVFVEPGFITQPAGGNSDYDVTFDPIGYTLIGVGFSF